MHMLILACLSDILTFLIYRPLAVIPCRSEGVQPSQRDYNQYITAALCMAIKF